LVGEATQKLSNVDDIIQWLHDDPEAYYGVARKRTLDSLVHQAVNSQGAPWFGPEADFLSISMASNLQVGKLNHLFSSFPQLSPITASPGNIDQINGVCSKVKGTSSQAFASVCSSSKPLPSHQHGVGCPGVVFRLFPHCFQHVA